VGQLVPLVLSIVYRMPGNNLLERALSAMTPIPPK
jgi:hypothetical protein